MNLWKVVAQIFPSPTGAGGAYPVGSSLLHEIRAQSIYLDTSLSPSAQSTFPLLYPHIPPVQSSASAAVLLESDNSPVIHITDNIYLRTGLST